MQQFVRTAEGAGATEPGCAGMRAAEYKTVGAPCLGEL
jgi:hypothetical protein